MPFTITRIPVAGRDIPQGGFTWGKSAPVPAGEDPRPRQ
jgi:hypothetical protein